MPGVIGHIANPTVVQSIELARAAEGAAAEWIGFADAFWWRDVWMTLARVASETSTISIGPAMTNAYLRHPFHTVSALATLQELAPHRTFVGLTAGGSEVTVAAGLSRADAPERVRALVSLLRGVAGDQPLDTTSGRSLDVALARVPVLMAARGDRMLRTAGAIADQVLLWAIPDSDLDRSVQLIHDGAAAHERADLPALIWAPLVEHEPALRPSIMQVAVYASLNTHRDVRDEWGLDDDLVERVRATLVAGGTTAAADLVPEAALDDLLVPADDPAAIVSRARGLGVTSLAVPGYGIDNVADHIGWATTIEADL